jgi:hypothetical protein
MKSSLKVWKKRSACVKATSFNIQMKTYRSPKQNCHSLGRQFRNLGIQLKHVTFNNSTKCETNTLITSIISSMADEYLYYIMAVMMFIIYYSNYSK